MPWKWRKKSPLPRFIYNIHIVHLFDLQPAEKSEKASAGLSYPCMAIAPGREALNDILRTGSWGGGMQTGYYWEPFEITEEEYREITAIWKSPDWWKMLRIRPKHLGCAGFVFDEEILAASSHYEYICLCCKKYKTNIPEQQVE